MNSKNELYSVVIPVFESADIVKDMVAGVRAFFIDRKIQFEIILVNDGSSDNSWEVIKSLAEHYSEVVAIDLLKNYGQHHANLCGFNEAKGSYVITMDDDLQNPPEEIGKLIDAAQDGYDLVIGRFENKKHSWIRCFGSRFVGWLNRKVFDVKGDLVLTNFRIVHRTVVDRICRERSAAPYIPGLVLKYSSTYCNVLVKHRPRAKGKSGYTWRKLFRLVTTILFNHSTIPLRYCALFGFFVSGASFFVSLLFLLRALFFGTMAPGWPTLVVLMSFFNGVLIMFLSVIGEYLIRIQREHGIQQSYEVRRVVRK